MQLCSAQLSYFSNILLNPPYTDLLLTHTDDMLCLQLHTAQSQFFSLLQYFLIPSNYVFPPMRNTKYLAMRNKCHCIHVWLTFGNNWQTANVNKCQPIAHDEFTAHNIKWIRLCTTYCLHQIAKGNCNVLQAQISVFSYSDLQLYNTQYPAYYITLVNYSHNNILYGCNM